MFPTEKVHGVKFFAFASRGYWNIPNICHRTQWCTRVGQCTRKEDKESAGSRTIHKIGRFLSLGEPTRWASKWRLGVNWDKCVVVRCTRQTVPSHGYISVKITRNSWNRSGNYLDILLEEWLTERHHIQAVRSKDMNRKKQLASPDVLIKFITAEDEAKLLHISLLRSIPTYAGLI